MNSVPKCPKCGSEFTYEDRGMYVCPECVHEWAKGAAVEGAMQLESGFVTKAQAARTAAGISSLRWC